MQEDDENPLEKPASLYKIRLVSAGVFVSGLVATDLLLNFFCSSWSLVIYLVAGSLGAWRGESLYRRFSGDTAWSTFIRRLAIALALFSALGVVGLSVMPVNWYSKCAWRYCGRAMGPGLFRSPYSVGTPSCGSWMKCANEYQYSSGEYRELVRRMEQQGCQAP